MRCLCLTATQACHYTPVLDNLSLRIFQRDTHFCLQEDIVVRLSDTLPSNLGDDLSSKSKQAPNPLCLHRFKGNCTDPREVVRYLQGTWGSGNLLRQLCSRQEDTCGSALWERGRIMSWAGRKQQHLEVESGSGGRHSNPGCDPQGQRALQHL